MLRRIADRFSEPVDVASIVAFRILFGLLATGSAIRFLAKGGVDRCYVEPITFFHYTGFAWIVPGSRGAMIAAYVALALLGAMIAAGLAYRLAAAAFFAVFTYVHLTDVSNYLNHYYLVSLVAMLLVVVPAHRAFSLDARLGVGSPSATAPRWALAILRFQFAVVYVYAAVAKITPDWLLYGQPLQIWMGSQSDVPFVGPLLGRHDVALALSWAGFLNDALAVPLLCSRRTRGFGFAMIVTFHAVTNAFFNIGIFPILMPIGATLFFDPSYPRALARRLGFFREAPQAVPESPRREAPSRLLGAALAVHVFVQLVVPLRAFAYDGDVLWHEQGMRFSWRVMLRKKSGSVTYRVRLPGRSRDIEVHPRRYLNDFQEREFAGQPDLVLQLAHRVHDEMRERGHPEAQVFVDAWVSWNGRAPSRLIDPAIDLARVPDGFAPAHYVLPAPEGPPAVFPDRESLSDAVARATRRPPR